MREAEAIKQNKAFKIDNIGIDGMTGIIHIGGWDGSVIVSNGAGWEHVSVVPFAKRITPSWDDMCKIKDIFFKDDEAVIQIHPPKEDYVNNVPNCLHLWRCTYKDMILPPRILVGIPDGISQAQLNIEIKEAYEMAGEKF